MTAAKTTTGERRPGARERILAAAGPLFYEEGFGAIGIDRIIAEAGVAKASLYAHFASKDDLIAAYLDDADQAFWSWIDGALGPELAPADELVRIFELVEEQAASPACLGCTFQVTAAEFPSRSHPAHAVAARHKQSALDRFEALAEQAGARDPDVLATRLLIVMDGAWASVRMFGPGARRSSLGAMARTLLHEHT